MGRRLLYQGRGAAEPLRGSRTTEPTGAAQHTGSQGAAEDARRWLEAKAGQARRPHGPP